MNLKLVRVYANYTTKQVNNKGHLKPHVYIILQVEPLCEQEAVLDRQSRDTIEYL